MSRFENILTQEEIEREVRRWRRQLYWWRARYWIAMSALFMGQVALLVAIASLHPAWPW